MQCPVRSLGCLSFAFFPDLIISSSVCAGQNSNSYRRKIFPSPNRYFSQIFSFLNIVQCCADCANSFLFYFPQLPKASYLGDWKKAEEFPTWKNQLFSIDEFIAGPSIQAYYYYCCCFYKLLVPMSYNLPPIALTNQSYRPIRWNPTKPKQYLTWRCIYRTLQHVDIWPKNFAI